MNFYWLFPTDWIINESYNEYYCSDRGRDSDASSGAERAPEARVRTEEVR